MVRVYYDLVLWEEVELSELNEELKDKASEMVKRFQGYGLVSYNMRTEIPQAQSQQVYQQTQQQPQQQPQEQYDEPEQQPYPDDAVQPEPPIDDKSVQDEM